MATDSAYTVKRSTLPVALLADAILGAVLGSGGVVIWTRQSNTETDVAQLAVSEQRIHVLELELAKLKDCIYTRGCIPNTTSEADRRINELNEHLRETDARLERLRDRVVNR